MDPNVQALSMVLLACSGKINSGAGSINEQTSVMDTVTPHTRLFTTVKRRQVHFLDISQVIMSTV